ncbi:lysozyme inhibitor LprI family protein [Dyella flava]|uniref:Lysozyme inhibitor LprI N-terminal domain-containing protein n=1 Tax=Dyella flava TaxID=1920170 RepID=A0ABS2JY01_9GAMM|nr:hypothetical protein [Dyella flava]MBM7123857.1 hypothetical protein [Dyella flava]GLQ52593.1 hypothetical protein GCM10010872_40420 [Dyella flava]
MKTARLSTLLVGLLLAGPATAQIASYECTKAVTAAEHAICTSPSLGRKDVIAATYYDLLLHLKPAVPGMAYREFDDHLRDEQRQFLVTRNACGANNSCLEQSYDDRIAALRKIVDRNAAVVFDRPVGP